MQLGEMDLDAAAREAAGNWRSFESFAWHRRNDLPDADNWCIAYTHNRDSRLLDQSNADAIEEAMASFTERDNPDVVPEHHHHWACGWIDGYSIRVYRRGKITKAFRAYHELAKRLAEYPVLDEDDYCSREYEATLENLPDAAWRLKHEYELPDDWPEAVYRWLSDHDSSAVESRDDQGGYPTEYQLRAAFDGLGYEQVVAV